MPLWWQGYIYEPKNLSLGLADGSDDVICLLVWTKMDAKETTISKLLEKLKHYCHKQEEVRTFV